MSKFVNGLRTVNCGLVTTIQGKEVEILSKDISGHFSDIVCDYFVEDGKKVELTYHGSGHEIYFYKNRNDVQHYRSFRMNYVDLPNKYKERADKLISIHQEYFGE
jgi:hypothetical protein